MKKTKKNPATSSGKQPFSFAELRRSAGILLHITSLPSAFGIGDFGSGRKRFLPVFYSEAVKPSGSCCRSIQQQQVRVIRLTAQARRWQATRC